MESRKYARFKAALECSFSGDHIVGDGRVVDLSMGGCRIQSDATPPTGTYVELRAYLPDQDSPLKIDLAVARWSVGRECGLEFIRMQTEQQEHMRRLVQSLEVAPSR